jgi:purine-nucleoside phosphorylase
MSEKKRVEEAVKEVMEAARYIERAAGDFRPKTVVVLGTGLGKVAGLVADPVVIESKDIPHWPRSTAPGHAGQLLLGRLGGRPVAVRRGRVHYYEGCGMEDVVFPTRVMKALGIAQHVATNAVGGIDEDLDTGSIVLVDDHINCMGNNPLIGPAVSQWNPRFPDMTRAYSPRLLRFCEEEAARLGIEVKRGVYIAFSGPSYETPAEIRMARTLGASVVGMSTVPEIIVSTAMDMENAVISCVSNKAAGLGGEDAKLTEDDILRGMEAASDRVGALLAALMERLEKERV